MGSKFVSYVYWFLLLLFIFFPLQSSSEKVPALYIFGDSTVDAGNINDKGSKINKLPYGIDFNGKNKPNSTGRFTNGKTIADFLAIKLGLPLIPSYVSLSEDQRKHATTGMNYALGGIGILPSTNKVLNLDKQIDSFTTTVAKELPTAFKNQREQDLFLSKSIFLVSIGTNDYGYNYLVHNGPNHSEITKEAFANLLLIEFSLRLKRLFQLGAKKFLINNVGPLGCSPIYTRNTGICQVQINEAVKLYSDGIPKMLSDIQKNLKGTMFSYADNWKLFHEMEANGDIDTKHLCAFNASSICEDRDKFFYFDAIHTTEVTNFKLIEGCFDKSLCTPNIVQLINHDASIKI